MLLLECLKIYRMFHRQNMSNSDISVFYILSLKSELKSLGKFKQLLYWPLLQFFVVSKCNFGHIADT